MVHSLQDGKIPKAGEASSVDVILEREKAWCQKPREFRLARPPTFNKYSKILKPRMENGIQKPHFS